MLPASTAANARRKYKTICSVHLLGQSLSLSNNAYLHQLLLSLFKVKAVFRLSGCKRETHNVSVRAPRKFQKLASLHLQRVVLTLISPQVIVGSARIVIGNWLLPDRRSGGIGGPSKLQEPLSAGHHSLGCQPLGLLLLAPQLLGIGLLVGEDTVGKVTLRSAIGVFIQ